MSLTPKAPREWLLIEQAQAGSQYAFNELYEHYKPMLFRIARWGDDHPLSDNMQSVSMAFHRAVSTFKTTRSTPFSAWAAYVIRLNRSNFLPKSEHDKNWVKISEDDGEAIASAEASVLDDEAMAELYGVIDELPGAMHLHAQLDGYDCGQIAQLHDQNLRQVDNTLAAARRRLRAHRTEELRDAA